MLRNIFWGLLCIALIGLAAGCKKQCAIDCLNGGSCAGSVCSCPDPFSGFNCDTSCGLGTEGYMCQTLSRTKFIGTWSCTSSDQVGNKKTYLITFTANPDYVFMNLNNFNEISTYPIVCTLTGKDQFSIDPNNQDSLATLAGISGSGILNNNQLVINLSENNAIQFFATATKQ